MIESSGELKNHQNQTQNRVLTLKIKLDDVKGKILLTRQKQTRYQQIEDLCYVNQTTNEDAINSLNLYLGNLKKVLRNLQLTEQNTITLIKRGSSQYKLTIMKYKDRKVRGKFYKKNILSKFSRII